MEVHFVPLLGENVFCLTGPLHWTNKLANAVVMGSSRNAYYDKGIVPLFGQNDSERRVPQPRYIPSISLERQLVFHSNIRFTTRAWDYLSGYSSVFFLEVRSEVRHKSSSSKEEPQKVHVYSCA